MGRALLAHVALVVSILVVAESAAAQFIIPVSRLLHCEASASDAGGTVNRNPPDVSAGATSGALAHTATANSPMGSAQGSSNLSTGVNLTPNTISFDAGARGNILGPFTPLSGSGSATGQIVVDIPLATEMSHSLFTAVSGGGFTIFRLKIEAASGPILLDRTYSGSDDFNDNRIFFPAGRYTFTGSASDFIHQSGSSGGTMSNRFTVVPEPAAALALAATGLLVLRRQR